MVDFKKASAAKKTAAKKTTKGGSTALVPWDEKFAAYAKQSTEQVKDVGVYGSSISFGHNSITVDGVEIKGPIECVILGSTPHNRWYDGVYDAKNKVPPDCYAFAAPNPDEPGTTVAGTDPSVKPYFTVVNKQSPQCNGTDDSAPCPKNIMGTATVGKGKACSNTIRLGLLVAADLEDSDTTKAAELRLAHVSPTNTRYFAEYVKMLGDADGDYRRPPWAVITEITSHDDKKTQIRLEFKYVDSITDNDTLVELEKRFLKIQSVLQTPYSATATKDAAPAKSNAGKSGKFVGGKKK